MPSTASARLERESRPAQEHKPIRAMVKEKVALVKVSAREAFAAGRMRADLNAFAGVGNGLVLAFTLVGALVGLYILTNLGPQVIRAGGNFTTSIKATDFGDPTVNSLRPIMALIFSLGLLFGIVYLGMQIFDRVKNGK